MRPAHISAALRTKKKFISWTIQQTFSVWKQILKTAIKT
jgi:hypothetical protein